MKHGGWTVGPGVALLALVAFETGCGSPDGAGATEAGTVDAGQPDAGDARNATDGHTPFDAPFEVAGDATADSTVSLDAGPPDAARCAPEMVLIESFCVDRYEAFVVELGPDGGERVHSPYDVIGDASVQARSAPGVVPQGYISQLEATLACENAGKRLCSLDEFALACRGPDAGNYYPYGGETHVPGDCNEGKGSEMPVLFGSNAANWTYADFNDPRLNQLEGGLAPTGSYPHCVSPYGVYDCVGNLHEWGSDPADSSGHGRFRGGFYGDAEENGHGCLYVTSAHELAYHDYSTGFRCCRDAVPAG
jgi:hypothetical protein